MKRPSPRFAMNSGRFFALCLLVASLFVGKAVAAEVSSHIRVLASSCVTCHGANPLSQSAITGLAGLDEPYFVQKMQEFRGSGNEHEVMTQHAKGLTEQEIRQLAAYFAGQPRACPAAKKHPIEESAGPI